MSAPLSDLGLEDISELGGGYQSRGVYSARLDGDRVAVKVFDATDVDRRLLGTRLELMRLLGTYNGAVCAPVLLAGRLINDVQLDQDDLVLAVAYQFADGEPADMTRPEDASLMGGVLAELHAAFADLPAFDLPGLAPFPPRGSLSAVVTELGVPPSRLPDLMCCDELGQRQMLHGDFNSMNVLVGENGTRVVDFDDCGYGPVEFDVALTLYMVLVSASTGSQAASYKSFREAFLGGYCWHSGVRFADTTLDMLITYRVVVLANWLTNPSTGPPAVKTWPGSWRATLGRFIRSYLSETVTARLARRWDVP